MGQLYVNLDSWFERVIKLESILYVGLYENNEILFKKSKYIDDNFSDQIREYVKNLIPSNEDVGGTTPFDKLKSILLTTEIFFVIIYYFDKITLYAVIKQSTDIEMINKIQSMIFSNIKNI